MSRLHRLVKSLNGKFTLTTDAGCNSFLLGGEGWFTEHFTVLFKGNLGISLSLSHTHTHMHEVKGTCK